MHATIYLGAPQDFVDDDLLSCFLWAAGENAVAQPGWESPSVNPLKGIPLPPAMPPLPPAGNEGRGLPPMEFEAAAQSDHGGSDDGFDEMESDLVSRGGTLLSKEQKLTQRMQRKAESARVARLRKKEYVSGLEAEVSQLRAELVVLRDRSVPHAAGSADPPTLKEEGQRHRASMEALLKQSVLDAPEVNATEVTVEKYVANKRAQQVCTCTLCMPFCISCPGHAALMPLFRPLCRKPSMNISTSSRISYRQECLFKSHSPHPVPQEKKWKNNTWGKVQGLPRVREDVAGSRPVLMLLSARQARDVD